MIDKLLIALLSVPRFIGWFSGFIVRCCIVFAAAVAEGYQEGVE